MPLTKQIEDLFSELNANPSPYLQPAKGGKSGNVKADQNWLDGNRLVFRSAILKVLDCYQTDSLIKNTTDLLDKNLGHSNWIEDIGENREGTAEAYTRLYKDLDLNKFWTQVGLTVTVGENCRVATEQPEDDCFIGNSQ